MNLLPRAPSQPRPRSRETGFPEPFCGNGNTTLPHPDANLSPDACISADDIAVNRVLTRQRRSFLTNSKRKKHTLSYGRITPAMERMYSDMVLDEAGEPPLSASTTTDHQSRPSKDGAESVASTDGSGAGDYDAPSLLDNHDSQQGSDGAKRRRGMLRKLMHR